MNVIQQMHRQAARDMSDPRMRGHLGHPSSSIPCNHNTGKLSFEMSEDHDGVLALFDRRTELTKGDISRDTGLSLERAKKVISELIANRMLRSVRIQGCDIPLYLRVEE